MTPLSDQLVRNRLRNWTQMLLIVAGLALLAAVPGWLLAGGAGVLGSMAVVALGVGVGGRLPARVILARSGAGFVPPRRAPGIYDLLGELYRRAGLELRPALYHVPSAGLNAFAVGHSRDGGIAVTEGLLRTLSRRELAGVLAHEISHLRHDDTRVLSLAVALTQLTMIAATAVQMMLLVMLPVVLAGDAEMPWLALMTVAIAPTLASLLQLALSRNREYTADLEAAALTGDVSGLASALRTLQRHQGGWLRTLLGTDPRGAAPPWLQTHPPTAERIRRLLALSEAPAGRGPLRVDRPDRPVAVPRTDPLGQPYWLMRRL